MTPPKPFISVEDRTVTLTEFDLAILAGIVRRACQRGGEYYLTLYPNDPQTLYTLVNKADYDALVARGQQAPPSSSPLAGGTEGGPQELPMPND